MPAMMVGTAIGICTFQSSCREVVPNERAASTTPGDTWRMPRLVNRIAGGNGVDDRGE